MPWLPIYVDCQDLEDLSSWLNNEPDIAIIESTGEGCWQARSDISISSSGRYCLFHITSGPLPLLVKNWRGKDALILDPFAGWKERRTGSDSKLPYFGAGHPAIFWLNIALEDKNELGISSFEWIGNHYSVIGSPASEAAKKWWNRLRRWVKKNSTFIPRKGKIDGKHKEIYAFKGSLAKIKDGMNRASNP